MPHRTIQRAANRIALLTAGATPSRWAYDGAHTVKGMNGEFVRQKCGNNTAETNSRLNAEYIYAMQPVVGEALYRLLESQALLHSGSPMKCEYCISSNNPLNIPCPTLELARQILSLEDTDF